MTNLGNGEATSFPSSNNKACLGNESFAVPPLLIDPKKVITPSDLAAVAHNLQKVELTENARERIKQSRTFLVSQVEAAVPIYGITTGYGPLANHFLAPELSLDVQRNLIYHLSTGVGDSLPAEVARAALVVRLQTLALGHSGVREELVDHVKNVLNAGLAPHIPAMGTVGASGDLTPLAHAALALLGEGSFVTQNGATEPAKLALRRCGISPLKLAEREGLGLVNGTAVATAVAALNDVELHNSLLRAIIISLAVAEIFGSETMAWHERVGRVRSHPGQQHVHKLLSVWAETSSYLRTADNLESFHRLPRGTKENEKSIEVLPAPPQSPYSIRCVPQLYGALLEQLWAHSRTVRQELQSVSENPLVFEDEQVVAHAGNFYGMHVALVSDSANSVVSCIATHLDRCIARLTDPLMNNGLPAFLTGGESGLHSGFMGAQVTATALTAEIRGSLIPIATQSLPTNGNNQDVVPLGTIAARKVRSQLALLHRVEAIAALAVVQAMDLKANSNPISGYSQQTRKLYCDVRKLSCFLGKDRPLSKDIEALAKADWGHSEDSYETLYPADYSVIKGL